MTTPVDPTTAALSTPVDPDGFRDPYWSFSWPISKSDLGVKIATGGTTYETLGNILREYALSDGDSEEEDDKTGGKNKTKTRETLIGTDIASLGRNGYETKKRHAQKEWGGWLESEVEIRGDKVLVGCSKNCKSRYTITH